MGSLPIQTVNTTIKGMETNKDRPGASAPQSISNPKKLPESLDISTWYPEFIGSRRIAYDWAPEQQQRISRRDKII